MSRRGVWLPPDLPCTIIHKSTYKRKKCTNERKCTIKTVNLPSLTNHLEFPLIFTSYSSQALNLVYALSQRQLFPPPKRYARNRSSTQGRIFKLRPLDPLPPPSYYMQYIIPTIYVGKFYFWLGYLILS